MVQRVQVTTLRMGRKIRISLYEDEELRTLEHLSEPSNETPVISFSLQALSYIVASSLLLLFSLRSLYVYWISGLRLIAHLKEFCTGDRGRSLTAPPRS